MKTDKLHYQAFLILICLLLFPLNGYAQRATWGVVPTEDMNMQYYPQDSSASTVILSDYSLIEVPKLNPNFSSQRITEHHSTRIKIFDKTDYDNIGVGDIIFPESVTISGLTAQIYYPTQDQNGAFENHQLADDELLETNLGEGYTKISFAFPKLTPGAILDIRYTFHREIGLGLPNWAFHNSLPTRWSEVEYQTPINMQFNIFNHDGGNINPILSDRVEGNIFIRNWHAEKIPAVEEEAYAASVSDQVSRIHLTLKSFQPDQGKIIKFPSNWEEQAGFLWFERPYRFVVLDYGFKPTSAEISAITEGYDSEIEIVSAIYNHVRTLGFSHVSNSIARKIHRKIAPGDSVSAGDIATHLVSLLTRAGINASLALISTRTNGAVNESIPDLNQFNRIIVVANILDRLVPLDATNKNRPFNILPSNYHIDRAWVIDPFGPYFASIVSLSKDIIQTTIDASWTGEEELVLTLALSAQNHAGYILTRTLQEANNEEKFIDDTILPLIRLGEIDSASFKLKEEDLSTTFRANLSLSGEEIINYADDLIYISPKIIGSFTENPFKRESRIAPIDFSIRSYEKFTLNIPFPDGYKLAEKPADQSLSLPNEGGIFTRTTTVSDKGVSIVYDLQITTLQFAAEDYNYLRNFFDDMLTFQDEPILFERVPPSENN